MNKDGSSVCYTAEGEAETAVSSSDLEAAKNTVNLMLDAESHVVGWSTVPNDDKATTVTFAKDKIVTKVYPVIESGFWVKFDTDGGSHVQSVFCEPGITLELSQVPTRSGYTFDGWYIDDQKVTSVSAEATVTARWKANSETEYTVIHWLENADDDEYSSEDIEEKTGATNSTTNAQAKSYSGFTAQAITQKTIAGDGSTIVNVYYKRNVYDVKFMKFTCNKEEHTHFFCGPWCNKEEHQHSEKCYTEITGLTIHAKYGANIRDKWPNKPESAWNVSTDGNTWQAGIDVMPLDGATFYQRGQNSSHTMVASYYLETISGGKYELDHQDTVYGQGDSVTKEDRYSITGFTLNEGKSTRIGRDYNGAKFYYDRNSYNIVFMNKGAEDSKVSRKYQQDISNANYTPNKPAGVPANFTFAGWYDNELCEGTAYDFTGKTMPAQNITLYAKWQAPQVNATVYLSASADSKSETFSVPYGKKITESEDFNAIIARIKAETGEAPSAWFVVTGEGRVLFDLDTPLYSSVTLYPFFASSSEGYTVTYKEEGTDKPAKDEQKYLTGSRAGILAPVNGENFRAWKTEDNKLIYPGDKITVTKNITLRAVYTIKPQTETITYHYNFGGSTQTFIDSGYPKNTNATVKSLSDVGFVAPTGYEFLGWATAPNGNVEYQPNKKVFVDANGDNNLYAVWQVKTYTVKWVDEDETTLIYQKDYEYGAMPKFEGVEPTKAADAQYTYTFKGWNKDYTEVKGNQTYVAVYEKTTNKYTVKWVDEDGTTLIDQKDYEYGAIPKFEGVEPTKAADAQYTYT
ncbi:MAG: InlB B-repeat-containing protein, partial [Agathobaculum butyriciproducens]